jgi:hypothetical protein
MPDAPPIRVLAAGMVGSGSTFLFNAIREILASDPRIPAVATYSDEWNPLFMTHRRLVLKSHWGIRALAPLAESGVLLPVVSVRHPGDSVCSDIERFGFTFDFALKRVELSLQFCAALRRMEETVLYRYEDRFTTNPRTAAGLAQILGIKLLAEQLTEISRKYGADSVRNYAATLSRVPGLMTSPDNPDDAWCPTTQIHRGHIGKQTSGRWRDLPPEQRHTIDTVCGEVAASFGYDCAP